VDCVVVKLVVLLLFRPLPSKLILQLHLKSISQQFAIRSGDKE